MKYVRVLGAVLFLPALAAAHPIPGVGDFYSGMLHPLLSLEQIVPLIALSLLAGQQERATAIGILSIFPAALIGGACAGLAVPPPSFLPLANIGSMVLLGLLVALSRRFPKTPLFVAAAVFGFVQGLSLGTDITPDEAWRFIPGAGLTALVVIAYGVGLVRRLKAPWGHVAVRVAGSWIAAIGTMVLGIK
jgi:hydrogenase/urease accessory protein HupE